MLRCPLFFFSELFSELTIFQSVRYNEWHERIPSRCFRMERFSGELKASTRASGIALRNRESHAPLLAQGPATGLSRRAVNRAWMRRRGNYRPPTLIAEGWREKETGPRVGEPASSSLLRAPARGAFLPEIHSRGFPLSISLNPSMPLYLFLPRPVKFPLSLSLSLGCSFSWRISPIRSSSPPSRRNRRKLTRRKF